MKTLGLGGLILLAVVCAVAPAQAQSTVWTNKTSGNWSDSDKWFPNVSPGPGTNALLTNNAATSYTVTNDVVNNTFANLTLLNRGVGTNTVLNNASGFNPAGNVIIGRNGLFDLNGLDVSFGGSLTVSNFGKIVVRGAGLVTVGNATLLGTLVITNSGLFQVGATGSGSITNGGTIRIGGGGLIVATVITNSGSITAINSGGGTAVITGSVANLYTGGSFGGGGVPGSAGINAGGLAADAILSLVDAKPFLNNLNPGTIGICSNGVLNLGGLTVAASTCSFTNRGKIGFFGGVAGSVTTLNAGTLMNDTNGELDLSPQCGANPGSTNFVNSDVVNYGAITLNGLGTPIRIFRSIPLNFGTIDLGALAGISKTIVQQGTLTNCGFINIYYQTTLSITNGGLVNDTNGVISAGRGGFAAAYFDQKGLMAVTNWGVRFKVYAADGVSYLSFTNNGVITINKPVTQSVLGNVEDIQVDTLFNNGAVTYIGRSPQANGLAISEALWVNGRITNYPSGVINVRSNALAVINPSLANQGTINVESNSLLGVIYTSTGFGWKGGFRSGTVSWANAGVVNMTPGAFLAAAMVSNSAFGTISGGGYIGPVFFQNMTNTPGGSLTSSVQNVTVGGFLNAGSLKPAGVFNVGAITNLSGGSIIGSGVIRSLNVTNYWSGSVVVTNVTDVAAKIQNQAGASILADGGTLTLDNGFFSNTQYGTIGATNGGVLKIGDGSQALTNCGTIWLSNGRLECGDLTVTNGSVSIDLDNLASSTNGLIQTLNLTLGGTGTLTLNGSGNKAVLIRYSGTRSGEFATVTGVPPGYRLFYGPAADGSLSLIPNTGAMILVR